MVTATQHLPQVDLFVHDPVEAKVLQVVGIPIVITADHTASESSYAEDPDGKWVEIYVDVSDVWRSNPPDVAAMRPLAL